MEVELSPLSDDEEGRSEDEDSTFHREIILQDNYSEADISDVPLDAEETNSNRSHTAVDEGSAKEETAAETGNNAPERRVRFASDVIIKPAAPENPPSVVFTPTNLGLHIATNYKDHAPAQPATETPNIGLLSFLPSSIIGNAVEMSKYLSEYVAAHPDLEDKLRHIPDADKRKELGEEIFPESALTNKFRTLDTTQAAIEGAASLAAKYPYPPGALMQLMHDVFVSIPTNAAVTRLGIFYVYNHLIHKFGKAWSHPISFLETGLKRFCIPAITHSNRIKCSNSVHIITCINVWRQRHIYDAATCDHLEALVTSSDPKSSVMEMQTDTNTYTVNSEVGGVNTLRHLFNMPLVDDSFKAATEGINEEDLADADAPMHNQAVADAAERGRYEAFDYASRLTGQELILLHSSSLDLAALIEEGNKQFEILQNEIAQLEAQIKDE
ncbi:hypothetical protein, conserved [Babesia bigemina]|uniref:CID domain-containing protein n=1 Tax=Babesia bigemina TaxID=5866 RepID=A0A061DD73_BABBI|nr:hypothetical protein, conserved [Babesia bigemina]CDR96015.1 hypothetical protein, conserved [Babesia bigemina]|eukprot:XP_012768201.1 hypothetical protein, conserved [Babesia bigemina]